MEQTLSTSSGIVTSAVTAKAKRRVSAHSYCGLGAALASLTVKLLIAFNTFGTNDVLTFYIFGGWLSSRALEWTYNNTILFNHPPLTAWYLQAIYLLHQSPLLQTLGITFAFLLRLPGIVADLVVV